MKPIPQNKPEPDAIKMIKLVFANEGAELKKLIELSGFDKKNACRILQNMRGTANLGPALWPSGKQKRGYYITTPKGRANAGIAEPEKVETVQVQPKHYTTLVAINMTSHRQGAWDANAIARRGLAC